MSPPNSAFSAAPQPSYCLSRRRYRCQRLSVSLNVVPAGVGDHDAVELVAEQDLLELGLLLDVALLAALRQLVERRLGDVDVAGLDQLLHLAEQQREDQRADVRAVDVRVRHQDDLVVARALDVEVVADARAQRGDQRLDLRVLQHLVDARLLDVEDLAAQREHRLGRAIAALLGRAARGVALDDEQLGQRGVAHGAVGELARQRGVLQRGLAAREVARLARGGAGLGGRHGLLDDLVGLLRVLLEELGQRAVDDVLDEAGHARVAELGLGLALELRVLQLHRDDGGQALAHVLARQRVVLLAQVPLVPRVAVEGAGQRGAEARQVRAALVRVDVVGEAVDRLLVGGVPLHRDLDRALVAVGLEEDDLLLDGLLVLVEVADEVLDPALVVELGLGALGAQVGQRDAEAAGEEGGLAQALLERRELEVERLEHLGVREEGDDRAGLVRRLALLQRALRHAASVGLAPGVAVALDLDVELLRQRVDDRDADAVEAAGDLVAAAVAELAAGVENGQHDLDGRLALLLHHRDGDAAAVVDDRDRVVGVDRDVDLVAVAGQRLVDRVVDDLVDQVVQPARAGRSDVHARPLADGLEPFQDRDVLCVVGALLLSVTGVGVCHVASVLHA